MLSMFLFNALNGPQSGFCFLHLKKQPQTYYLLLRWWFWLWLTQFPSFTMVTMSSPLCVSSSQIVMQTHGFRMFVFTHTFHTTPKTTYGRSLPLLCTHWPCHSHSLLAFSILLLCNGHNERATLFCRQPPPWTMTLQFPSRSFQSFYCSSYLMKKSTNVRNSSPDSSDKRSLKLFMSSSDAKSWAHSSIKHRNSWPITQHFEQISFEIVWPGSGVEKERCMPLIWAQWSIFFVMLLYQWEPISTLSMKYVGVFSLPVTTLRFDQWTALPGDQ